MEWELGPGLQILGKTQSRLTFRGRTAFGRRSTQGPSRRKSSREANQGLQVTRSRELRMGLTWSPQPGLHLLPCSNGWLRDGEGGW